MIFFIASILLLVALPAKLTRMLLILFVVGLFALILLRFIKGTSFGVALTQSFMGALKSDPPNKRTSNASKLLRYVGVNRIL